MTDVLAGTPLVERLAITPVLCWVVHRHGDKHVVRLITYYFYGRFYTDGGDFFPFARPLSTDDINKFSFVEAE